MGNPVYENITRIVLILLAALAIYYLVDIIRGPIVEMRKERERKQTVIRRLENARKAQKAYKDVKGKYASSWDSLMQFVKHDSMKVIKTIGDPNDTTRQIKRDTAKVLVKNSLFQDYPADSIQYAPGVGKRFNMDAGEVKLRGVKVPVFEIKDRKKTLGKVHKVGSMKKGTTTGNW